MNQVLSYNNYNPIINPLSNNYSPPVTPTRPCDLSYFPASGPRSDYPIAYEGQMPYEQVLSKWTPEPGSTEKRADKYKNFPTAVTSESVPDKSSHVFNESSPVFAEAKFHGPESSDYDGSPEVYDEAKYTDSTTNSNLDFADSPEFAESRTRSDESSRIYDDKYNARINNNNNNLEYDKSHIYESDRYNMNSNDQDYYPQNYPYSNTQGSSGGPQNPAKMEIYDMEQDFDYNNSHMPMSSHLYESCLANRDGTFPTVGTGALQQIGPDGLPMPRRRNTANKKERKRTLTLNKAFSLLRACIPNVPMDTKLSKIKTLKLAKEYIIFLLDTLSSSDPRAWTTDGFKADKALYSPRKTQTHNYKTALKAANENTDSNGVVESRKPKGRTGWPQDVWAFELKPQQFASSPSVRI